MGLFYREAEPSVSYNILIVDCVAMYLVFLCLNACAIVESEN